MISKKFVGIVGGMCLLGSGFTAGLIAADKTSAPGAAEMEAMMKLGMPGPEHAAMAKMAGKWNMTGKMWMDPSAPPQATTGAVTYEMAMDGRYLIEHVEGQPMMPGLPPFKGMNISGYDNFSKQYFFVWIDNAGTGIMTGWGNSKDGGKTIEYLGECPDPMTGKLTKNKSVMKVISDNEFTFDMFSAGPDGSWVKNFESSYTRAK